MSFAHLTLATRDVIASRDFFAGTLGWDPIERPGNIDIEAAWLRIAPGQELHLLRVPDFEPSGFEREFGRHFAVEYPADGFAGLKERLAKHGAELIDPSAKPRSSGSFSAIPTATSSRWLTLTMLPKFNPHRRCRFTNIPAGSAEKRVSTWFVPAAKPGCRVVRTVARAG